MSNLANIITVVIQLTLIVGGLLLLGVRVPLGLAVLFVLMCAIGLFRSNDWLTRAD